ncbi:transglycosylase SLT domain-containing protein [Streptomyces lunaelactis]|uniref:transglycosylase SLT domain-containing protein n=1 Tax=Streptomyces lunaelactis TaxID=1535768 RepID=UPI001585B99E|nr:transglycosylase SLT domain-containing protein [Streptomyces lunaelactis]NUK36423.1 transglycosylase SLT domain-containing protein [Streptomyces lunaelactis]NUK44680.1 transglycosylase SLT domain-containing protein [Streptomyces lunaelactis]NUK92683.1 transglycosylase SLT domain-containing protein [Streptomyces lunaelactis]NUL33196.1 transglycosylase SLT domain-containing protein [Streptomyces lunaelactis]
MTVTTETSNSRIARFRKFSVVGIATAGAAAAVLTLAPSPAQAAELTSATASATKISAADAPAAKTAAKAKKAKKAYPNNLDGWIKESLAIMKAKGIPGSYEGLHRNIMRESGGNPNAENGWDVNAQNGTPSKGLLQVIQPTFDAYHVAGTPNDLTDPVANITAAANYAADKYGSIDNVDSAY